MTEETENTALQLQQLIHQTIPLGEIMGFEVKEWSNNHILVDAPVAPTNINIHGTAFAGSIYSVCALTAWGFAHQRLLLEDVKADVVLAKAKIRYYRPIENIISSRCHVDEDSFQDFKKTLLEEGKSSLNASVQVQEQDDVQASMKARVVAKLS